MEDIESLLEDGVFGGYACKAMNFLFTSKNMLLCVQLLPIQLPSAAAESRGGLLWRNVALRLGHQFIPVAVSR